MFHRSSKILTCEGPGDVSRTVGEAFGVSKVQIQKPVKRKANVLEEYNGNGPSYSRCICHKKGNDEINSLTWRWFQDATIYTSTRTHKLDLRKMCISMCMHE